MRILAIVFNLFLLCVVVFLFAKKGIPQNDDWLIVIPMILAPILSLIVIFGTKGDNWFSLYLKRKALEEQQKIDRINGNKD